MTEESLFHQALARATPQERAAFLDGACAGRPELRAAVEALLAAHERSGDLLDQLTDPPQADSTSASVPPGGTQGEMFAGRYQLLAKIGEGGMGEVWMAEQTQPVRRLVAVKLVKPGMGSRQVLVRFEAERQALALMDHPNIARVLEAGAADGRLYFVMELVKGEQITRYCDLERLTPRQRLELFVPVCQAIQHAHQKGIIHRDIKPSNVLVARYDGKAVPKVIDFGIAKATGQQLTEQTQVTGLGAVVGTLEYMSPEQAGLSQSDIDTRSDVYSLGVLLYELLTGSTPLEKKRLKEAAILELLRLIREEEPPRPSTRLSTTDELPAVAANRGLEPKKLSGLVRGELDWIVMKALEKDRNRRYETAAALARDVERHLAGEAVEACPPTWRYRLAKFARRNQAALLTVSAFALLLLLGAGLSLWQAARADRNAEKAARNAAAFRQQRDQAEQAVIRQVVERLEGNLRQLEMVGLALDALRPEKLPEEPLESWMRAMLEKDKRIFGLAFAREKQPDYCLYLYRGPNADIQKKQLVASHGYDYRCKDWYNVTKKASRARWSPRPTFDAGANEVLIGYLVPLWRENPATKQQEMVGVVTVDLSVERFFKGEKVESWLNELGFGRQGVTSYGFVISHTRKTWNGRNERGVFISHPSSNEAYRFPRSITQLKSSDSKFAAMVERLLNGESGREIATDPWTRKRSLFLFAPVPSVEWTFVAVIEESGPGEDTP
jgi:serine/threonine protein kinase